VVLTRLIGGRRCGAGPSVPAMLPRSEDGAGMFLVSLPSKLMLLAQVEVAKMPHAISLRAPAVFAACMRCSFKCVQILCCVMSMMHERGS